MKNIYLIDFENVNERGLTNVPYQPDDHVYLLYTRNASKVSLDVLSLVDAKLKFIRVTAGKQSLDMHLVSYLGYLLHENGKDAAFYIVSNDVGFDGVVQFWKRKGFQISRREIPAETPAQKQEPQAQPQQEQPVQESSIPASTVLNNKIIGLYSKAKIDSKIAGSIASMVVKNIGLKDGKAIIYRGIVKQFGQKEGLKYYNIIKKEI